MRVMAVASLVKAMWMSARRSERIARVRLAERTGRCPSEGALDHPAMPPELGRGLHAAACDPRDDRAGPAFVPTPAMVVGLGPLPRKGIAARDVPKRSMELVGPLAGPPARARPHARNGVERRCERHAVMAVRARQRHAERRAPAVGAAMPLRARTAPIRRVRTDRLAPLPAPMDAASKEARDPSSSPARSSRSNSTRCRRSPTPAVRHGARTDGAPRLTQSRRRRQHVMPEQPNTSRGSLSHGRPVRRTNTLIPRAGPRGPAPARGLPSASAAPRTAAAPPPPTSHRAQTHAHLKGIREAPIRFVRRS